MAKQSLDQSILRIKSLEKKGDLDAARAICQTLIAQFPANKRLRQMLDQLGTSRPKPATVRQPPQAELEVMVRMFEQGQYKAVMKHGEGLARRYPYSPILFNIFASAAAKAGEVDQAVDAYRRAIELDPGFLSAINNLGGILKENHREIEAIDCFTRSLRLKPDQPFILRHLAEMENALLRHRDAIEHFRRSLELNPIDVDTLCGMINALIEVDELDEALQVAERAIKLKTQKADPRLLQARIYRLLGRKDEAAAAYEEALKISPDNSAAYAGLSAIHRFVPDDPLLHRITAAFDAAENKSDRRCPLAFVLAKAHEDLGNLQRSFDLLKIGNRLRREAAHYSIRRDEKMFADLRMSAPNIMKFALPAGVTPIETVPIFIVAMPRSGTSLTEQILSAHSMVAGGGELQHLSRLGDNLATGVVAPTTKAIQNLRSDYLARIRPNANGRPWMTDKMPHNFRLVALIRAALPEAKIIHVVRDPAAVCWSNYRQHFTSDMLNFGCDLQDLTRYYTLYAELMALWKTMFGEAVYSLDYDRLTVEQEDETRALLAHLGLPWEDACLAPQRNQRGVRTASEQQVKQAVYTGSSEAWKKFEPFLEGAFDALPR